MNLIIKDLDMDNEIVLLQLTGALLQEGVKPFSSKLKPQFSLRRNVL